MTIAQNRRDFIGIAAGVALATTAAGALAQSAPKTEYAIQKLPFDPARIKGLSEKLLVSHYENNYSGAVKRLNAISAQLAALDMATAPIFVQHAYHMDYGARAAAYVDAVMQAIRWDNAAALFEKYSREA